MEISVIICTKNRTTALGNLLDSLNRQDRVPDEVVIVDGSDSHDTEEMVGRKKEHLLFGVVYQRTAPGLTRQRNIGVDLSYGNYLFFFDDDVLLEREFLETVLDTFKEFKDANVGGVMGRIINVPQSPKAWDVFFKKLFFLSDFGRGRLKPSGLPSINIGDKVTFVESLSGGCTAYLKEVFNSFRFDENLKGYAYLEDVDFSYRVGKLYRLLYQPDARLSHFPSTYIKADSKELRKMFVRHHVYLFRKNMPKDFFHYIAFWISLIGALLYNGLILRDFRACRGIFEGLLEPLEC